VTSFFNQVLYRGQTGASDTPSTNYGPWGGSISFDTRKFDGSARVWNFSLTETDTFKTDFVGNAVHEICHILGIGNADSWLDRADLIEISWEVKLPASGTASVANGEVHLKVPTITGFTYRILQGNLNAKFVNLGDAIAGNQSA
jgi:hypothetical protein